jgi:protein SCO1/2
MSRRARGILLATTTVLVIAFALAVFLDGPAARGPAGPGASVSGGPGASVSGGTSASGGFDGSLLPAGVRARDFTLTDQDGRGVSLRSYRGKVTILTFLYSTCTDVCPLIAQQIRGALDDLGEPTPALAISVAPEQDTPANVRRFLAKASLSGRMEYLSGPRAALAPIWHAYGILPESAGDAASDHSAYVLLIDRKGIERVAFGVEQLTPESLAHDIRRLRTEPR